jgi:hypothetical protein
MSDITEEEIRRRRIEWRLRLFERERNSPEYLRKLELEDERVHAAYEVINREVDALIVLQPSFEGALEELGQVDEDAALKLASNLLDGFVFDPDDDSNVWDAAKAKLNLPTLARAAQMLHVYEAVDTLRELLDADLAKHPDKPACLETPRPKGSTT